MRIRGAITIILAVTTALGCNGDPKTTGVTSPPPPPPPPEPTVLLKDIDIPSLPAPFYHFDYDATGRISAASFASGLTKYDVTYDGGRISDLSNKTLGNQDRLEYTYDDAGHVTLIKYVHADGLVFKTVFFTYNGRLLTRLERDRRVDAGFIIEKTMSFAYGADGNVSQITEHFLASDNGQTEATTIDRFEQYDDKINVDGFSLLHTEFFDHLILLPGVRLQTGNPKRVTHTGDGDNYQLDYTYTYDDSNRPLTKSGDLTFLTGPNTGKKFQTLSQFSYY